jgi:hypothetical protein
VITFDRNQRSPSTGLGDHLPPESVITFDRNTHTTFALPNAFETMQATGVPENGEI